jgi:hypothetical protein
MHVMASCAWLALIQELRHLKDGTMFRVSSNS